MSPEYGGTFFLYIDEKIYCFGMSDTMITALVAPAVLMVLGGIGFGFKWLMSRSDKKLDAKLQARNQERDEIKAKIASIEAKLEKTEADLRRVVMLVMSCKHEDCEVKAKVLAELNAGE